MDNEELDKWVREDPARGSWLARRIGVTYEFVRLMARGRKKIPGKRVKAITAAMRVRERAELMLK